MGSTGGCAASIGSIQMPVLPYQIYIGANNTNNLSILSKRPKINQTLNQTPLISKITALCLSLDIALQVGQYLCIINLSSITILAREASTCMVNLQYSLQLKSKSFYRGQSRNSFYKTTKSYNIITLRVQRRHRNPKPIRLSYITLLLALSRQQASIYLSYISILGYIFKQRASSSTSHTQGRNQPFSSFRKLVINYIKA